MALPAPAGGTSPWIAAPYNHARAPSAANSSPASACAGISSSRAHSSIPPGPTPASSFSGPASGGKPASIVSRQAPKCSRYGVTNRRHAWPSPGPSASRDATVSSTSRARTAALPSGSGCA
jgi:hypothetical protein